MVIANVGWHFIYNFRIFTDLTNEEIHWLIIFAGDNEFFASLYDYYRRKGYLTHKQHYYLVREIEKAEEDGDTLLTTEEIAFLRDNAEIDQDLKEILDNYEDNGYLEE